MSTDLAEKLELEHSGSNNGGREESCKFLEQAQHIIIFAISKNTLHLWLNYSMVNRTPFSSCDLQLTSSHLDIRN